MEETQKLQHSRKGHRAHLTKVTNKAAEMMAKEEPNEMVIASLNSIIGQLAKKRSVLHDLNEKIINTIDDPEDLEREIFETEDIDSVITERSTQISAFILSLSTPSVPHPAVQISSVQNPPQAASQPPNNPDEGTPIIESHVVNVAPEIPPPQASAYPNTNHISRLPKLNLPTFSGNPLNWLTFWDSFNVAVNSNPNLEGVQKFNYLRAQLTGDASRAITGFPLTNNNYEQAVDLLKERFGHPQKIINAHMQALLELPSPTNKVSSIQLFHDSMENHVRGLASLGKSHESYGDLLVPIILGKLPNDLRRNLAREHSTLEWTFKQLRDSIAKEIRILEAGIHNASGELPSTKQPSSSVTASFHMQTRGIPPHANKSYTSAPRKKCAYCKGPHPSNDCHITTDCQKRWSIVKAEALCFNCLGHHRASACQSKNRCRQCKGKHHSSLCTGDTKSTSDPDPTITANDSTPKLSVHTTLAPISTLSVPTNTVSLLKTAIATVGAHDTYCEANILFDEGAQRSFITQSLANQLNLQPKGRETISLSAFGASLSASKSLSTATVNVVTGTNEQVPVHVLVVENIATPLQLRSRANIHDLPHLRGLHLAHPVTSDESFEISLLVGADHYWDLVQDKVIRGSGPTAMQSKIGYLLSGPLHSYQPQESAVNLLQLVTPPREEEFNLERFWSLESVGVLESPQEDPNKNALKEYQKSSITRETDGSYKARFPWKEEHPPLPSNYTVCERRTRSMVRRLSETPALLKTYGEIIRNHEERGFIEKVPTTQPSDKAHYIPHHPVRKESSTTPIRIVYDCSCRQSSNSPSLNDCLVTGPPLLNDMCAIMLRFRTYPFGFSTDIEKAFLHVGLNECDRDFTRFLWLSNPNDPDSDFQIYRFKVVLFGSSSSPFMLNAALHSHLDTNSSPVSRNMQDNLYVDNVISGCDTEQEALQYYEESRTIMTQGKFNLRSWASNSPSLRAKAANQNAADTNEVVHLLGLRWNPSTDTLSLTPRDIRFPSNQLATKRNVLQESSKMYDPLGFVSPVTVQAKIFIQELWERHLEWDEPLPPDLAVKWNNIATEIQAANKVVLPRCYFSPSKTRADDPQLHVFADASPKAYGAVAYICDGDQTSMVMAKSRVAPLKKLTLPQLELMAALVAARLATFINQALTSRFNNLTVKLWSDSEIVLHWLHSQKQLKQFVTNRIQDIKHLFPASAWSHCPTHDNPADLLTRGITAEQLHVSVLWEHGPHWLSSQTQWPCWNPSKVVHIQTLDTTNEETASSPTSEDSSQPTTGIHQIIDVSRYSTLKKLLKVTAYVLRFITNLKNPDTREEGPLTLQELCTAQRHWIKNCQETTYHEEFTNLLSHCKTRLPLVRQLRIFVDDGGLLRCGGRIHNAPLRELARFPYLLPANHPLSALIVYEAHSNQMHSGVNSTVTALRQSFWITSMRQYVKKLLRRCVTCRKLEATAYKAPDPAPLPKRRVQESAPFSVTGVDFTGPLYIRSNSGETKGYICLFTCAVSRAIHLEVVPDLSERTFLKAFRRFAGRRSTPRHMISDNASTYLAAADQLKELFQSPSLKEALSHHSVNWEFIPKRAPWYGGFWERLIGLSKKSLKKTLGRAFLTMPELQTLVVEVEAILNDRPLTYVSSDIADEEPLTPSHLLYGRRITSLPYPVIEDEDLTDPDFGDRTDVTQRAKAQAAILQRFWSRWRHEYLTALREFHRTSGTNEQSIKEGDVVLVHDDNPRSFWKMAVVESLIKGGDGFVRAANIRTKTGRTNRPITKLYPLEISTRDTEQEIQSRDTSPDACEAQQPIIQPRPRRATALAAKRQISEWTRVLRAPPEDVERT